MGPRSVRIALNENKPVAALYFDVYGYLTSRIFSFSFMFDFCFAEDLG